MRTNNLTAFMTKCVQILAGIKALSVGQEFVYQKKQKSLNVNSTAVDLVGQDRDKAMKITRQNLPAGLHEEPLP